MMEVTDSCFECSAPKLYLLFVNISSIHFPCGLLKHLGDVVMLTKEYCRNNDCIAGSDTSILRSPNINMFPIDNVLTSIMRSRWVIEYLLS